MIRIVIIVLLIIFLIIAICVFKCLVDRYFDKLNKRQKYAKEQALALQNDNNEVKVDEIEVEAVGDSSRKIVL